MIISFPEVKAGQALISAIAIARQGKFEVQEMPEATAFSWKDFDRDVVEKTPAELLPEDKNARVGVIYEAEAALLKGKYVKKQHRNQTGIFFGKGDRNSIEWNISTGLAQVYALRFKYMNSSSVPVKVRLRFIDSKGVVLKDDILTFPDTPEKWRMMSTTTGTYINAGQYRVVLTSDGMEGLAFDALEVQ